MPRFIIPAGEPHLKVKHYSDQSRRAWDLAAAARSKFIAYKRSLRRFTTQSTETEATRVLLQQVNTV